MSRHTPRCTCGRWYAASVGPCCQWSTGDLTAYAAHWAAVRARIDARVRQLFMCGALPAERRAGVVEIGGA